MRPRLVLWVACATQLLIVLDVSVVNIALPSIGSDLAMSAAAGSWVALAYGVAFGGALLVGARVADSVGVSRALGGGVIVFVVASMIGGLAMDGAWVVIARAGQGLGAAIASPATLTLITTTFAEGPGRTRAISIWTAVSVAGGGVGNVLSGVIVEVATWRAVFLINVPVGAAILFAARTLSRHEGKTASRGAIEPIAAVLAIAASVGMIYGLSTFGDPAVPWSWPAGALAGGVLLLAVLVRQQRRSLRPLLPSDVLRSRSVAVGNVAILLSAGCFQVAIWYFLTYRMQGQLGMSPLATALAFLPLTVSIIVVNLWCVPALASRLGARTLAMVGATIAAAGTAWLAYDSSGGLVVALITPMLVVGIGGGLMNTPLAMLATGGVSRENAGAASGAMNTAKQFGGATGLAVASAFVATPVAGGAAFALMTGFLLAAALVALAVPRES
ncbi:MFS transporter [Epidermidibacterium keratini]